MAKAKNGGALDLIKAFKSISIMFFIMWLITFVFLIISLVYIVNIKGKYEKVETTTTEVEQETDKGNNYYFGKDGEING